MAQRNNNNNRNNNRNDNNFNRRDQHNNNRNRNNSNEYREKNSGQNYREKEGGGGNRDGNQPQRKREQDLEGILMTATISLVDDVDKRVVVVLRDGKKLYGTMRSFDQYANIVLEDTVERIFVGDKYCEQEKGSFVIRGENVAMLGEMDPVHEQEVTLKKLHKIPVDQLLVLQKEQLKKEAEEDAKKRQILRARGLGYDLEQDA